MAVGAALKDAALLGLWIGLKEQQELLVQEPGRQPEKHRSQFSHVSTLAAADKPSGRDNS